MVVPCMVFLLANNGVSFTSGVKVSQHRLMVLLVIGVNWVHGISPQLCCSALLCASAVPYLPALFLCCHHHRELQDSDHQFRVSVRKQVFEPECILYYFGFKNLTIGWHIPIAVSKREHWVAHYNCT